MASSLEYVQHVAAQLSGAGAISYKKLFGEYGLWCGGTFFGTVENNQFYIKVTEAGHKHLPEAEPVAPHGGRPGMYLVEELDDREPWSWIPAVSFRNRTSQSNLCQSHPNQNQGNENLKTRAGNVKNIRKKQQPMSPKESDTGLLFMVPAASLQVYGSHVWFPRK